MSSYKNKTTGAVAEIDPAVFAAWVAAGNPKAEAWEAYTPPPPDPVVPQPYRVSKDRLMMRIAAKGDAKVIALDDILLAQPRAQQILWRDFAWFSSDNASVRALITAIGLDPEEILAPEESA